MASVKDKNAVTRLKGVGPKLAERLERIGVFSIPDLLFHLPLRYQDRTRVVPIGSLNTGDQAVIEAEVMQCEVVLRGRRSLLCHLSDGSGQLTIRLFYFNAAQKNLLSKGARVRCFGEVRAGPRSLEMIHPEFRRVTTGEPVEVEDHLTPVYPTTEGLHQLSLRSLTDQALVWLAETDSALPDYLPASLLDNLGMPKLEAALKLLHRPSPEVSGELLECGLHPAQRRLAFEELVAHQLSLRQLRQQVQSAGAISLENQKGLRDQFIASLPFKPTGAQNRVIQEIDADIFQSKPMLRLVQGDVGSGKTVVAAAAVVQAVAAGYQAAVMAPTELLAEQHYKNFSAWLGNLDIEVAWVSGRLKGKSRKAVTEKLASGEIGVAVGTHALFQNDMVFARLALVVIDEQHRFGVHQRLALRDKGSSGGRRPHQLIMTATPIPRTLAMSAYADLDTSVIDELPPGRTPVKTAVVSDARRPEVVERVAAACAEGSQVYWVCTLIDESEALQCEAAEDTAMYLAEALPEVKVGLVHGRMKAADKEARMQSFKNGEINLLVATTVIEVGVDVPNASLMIIENAERLGLAQLHQLRGRVGRGSAQSSCVLLYKPPLSQAARERLDVMRRTTDGFEIAQADLEQRGPGEVLGTRQTGALNLRIADLVRDQDMLDQVQKTADELLESWPDTVAPLLRRWVGEGTRYGEV